MRDTIFDISHWQGDVDFEQARMAGMEAVICKATQGLEGFDNMFGHNVEQAQKAGLLVGAYHFGTGDPGDKQADHFLKTISTRSGMLLVLDFEENKDSQMTVTDALDFVLVIQEQAGVWPVVYANRSYATMLSGSKTIVNNCPLWYASYRDIGNPPAPPAGWSKGYTLWQYRQDGKLGGVAGDVDRDAFCGADLKQWWDAYSTKGE